jgi:hypothetical protein
MQYTGRVLQAYEPNTISSEIVLREAHGYSPRNHQPQPQPRILLMYDSNDKKQEDKIVQEKTIPTSSYQTNNRSSYRNKLAKMGQNTTDVVVAPVVSQTSDDMDWKDDTSYFFCSEGERFLPPGHNHSPKEKLSIIIPSQMLNMTELMLFTEEGDDQVTQSGEYLIEIHCQIQSMNFYPLLSQADETEADLVVPFTL